MLRKLSSLVLLAATALAQVPDGHFVVSCFYSGGENGGLWVVDPRVPGEPRPITNLPVELVGLPTPYSHGANCVKILPDGRLAVGETEIRPNQPAELYLLTLAGLEVVDVERISIGVGTISGPSINEIVVLPDGDLLLSGSSDDGKLFRADLESGTAQAVRFSGLTMTWFTSAIGLDPTGATLYITDHASQHEVRSMSVNGGPTQPVGFADQHGLMALDHTGDLFLPIVATVPRIDRMDPRTGLVSTVGLSGGIANAIEIEPATGKIVYVTNGYNGPGRRVRIMDPQTGVYSELAELPFGFPSGIAIAPDPATYGNGSDGAAAFRWSAAPNPGGLPRVGNASFGLQVVASTGDATGVLLAAAAPAEIPVLGLTLLLDPASTVAATTIPASGLVNLPLPNTTTLVGAQLFLQGIHADAGAPGGLAATDGLRITLLR